MTWTRDPARLNSLELVMMQIKLLVKPGSIKLQCDVSPNEDNWQYTPDRYIYLCECGY